MAQPKNVQPKAPAAPRAKTSLHIASSSRYANIFGWTGLYCDQWHIFAVAAPSFGDLCSRSRAFGAGSVTFRPWGRAHSFPLFGFPRVMTSEGVMPIRPFLSVQAFDPKTIQVM